MIVAYVVLHYLATQDTIECVQSICNNIQISSEDSVEIIIVDNGSPNQSYEVLQETFGKASGVHLIKSEKNLGFAKGNNLGFQYAKYQLNADFIVLLNNDTIISQPTFNDVIIEKYYEKQYAVMGPDIVAADGLHQNPGTKQSWGLSELWKFRLKKRILFLMLTLGVHKAADFSAKRDRKSYHVKAPNQDISHTILHGACYIFSPLFVQRFDGLCDKTFLYMEEDILKLMSDYYGFHMLYSPELKLMHKEDAATNMIPESDLNKLKRKTKHLLRSSGIYCRLKMKMTLKKKVVVTIEKTVRKIKGPGYHLDLNIPLPYLGNYVRQRFAMLLRGKWKTIGFQKCGKIVFCGKKVKFRCKSKIQCGTGVTFQRGVYVDALSLAGVVLGDGSSLGEGTVIRCSGNMKEIGKGFHLGKKSSLADNCFVGSTGGVYIGNDVIGGQNIRFHSSNHNYADTNRLIREQGVTARGIRIGDNCWIGAGAVFCDGVTIGNGCVIAANAVVTKSFPDNSIIGGVPARIIGQREEKDK